MNIKKLFPGVPAGGWRGGMKTLIVIFTPEICLLILCLSALLLVLCCFRLLEMGKAIHLSNEAQFVRLREMLDRNQALIDQMDDEDEPSSAGAEGEG